MTDKTGIQSQAPWFFEYLAQVLELVWASHSIIIPDDDRSVTKDIQKIIKYVNIKESNNISLPNKKRLISSFQFWHLLRKQGTLVVITMKFSRNKELWALHLR